jgi:glutathione peroxidase
MIATVASLTAMLISAPSSAPVRAAGEGPAQTVFDFSVPAIDGSQLDFAAWQGKVLLIVNTASFCGYTGQYEGLQKLWTMYEDQGLVVVGVPSNDFSQEPKPEDEIKSFCEGAFGVTFPLTGKLSVTGTSAHPLYQWLSASAGKPNWNFHKYLVGRDGQVLRAFSTQLTPTSGEIVGWIEKALAGTPSKADATPN